jgi:hypothetical protein
MERLEVDLAATTPLRGVVRCGDLQEREFEGWVGLAAAVDACVAEARCEAADGRASQGSPPSAASPLA